jgi:hypothetical protein
VSALQSFFLGIRILLTSSIGSVDFKWNGPLIFLVSIKNSAKMIELSSTNYARCTLYLILYILHHHKIQQRQDSSAQDGHLNT